MIVLEQGNTLNDFVTRTIKAMMDTTPCHCYQKFRLFMQNQKAGLSLGEISKLSSLQTPNDSDRLYIIYTQEKHCLIIEDVFAKTRTYQLVMCAMFFNSKLCLRRFNIMKLPSNVIYMMLR